MSPGDGYDDPESNQIPNQSVETIAEEFVHKIIIRYGFPKQLLTDQGQNFVSTLFKGVCEILNVRKCKPYPTSRMTERLHKTLSDIISHFVTTEGTDWDNVVPYALMAYRIHHIQLQDIVHKYYSVKK